MQNIKLNSIIYIAKEQSDNSIELFNKLIKLYNYKEVKFNCILQYLIVNSIIIYDAKQLFYSNNFFIDNFSIFKIYWINDSIYGSYIIIRNFNESNKEKIIEYITLSNGPIINYLVGIIEYI
jgi:hypothetical protein